MRRASQHVAVMLIVATLSLTGWLDDLRDGLADLRTAAFPGILPQK